MHIMSFDTDGAMTEDLDLIADLNAQDDDGFGWSTLSDALMPERIVVGAMVLAGNRAGTAVVRVVAVDDDGQCAFFDPARVGCEEPPSPRSHRRLTEGVVDGQDDDSVTPPADGPWGFGRPVHESRCLAVAAGAGGRRPLRNPLVVRVRIRLAPTQLLVDELAFLAEQLVVLMGAGFALQRCDRRCDRPLQLTGSFPYLDAENVECAVDVLEHHIIGDTNHVNVVGAKDVLPITVQPYLASV